MTSPGDLPDWQRRVVSQDATLLYTGTLAGLASTAVIDVSQFNSLVVDTAGNFANGVAEAYALQWFQNGHSQLARDYMSQPVDQIGHNIPGMICPVRYDQVQIVNNALPSLVLSLYGSQRPAAGLVGVGYGGNDNVSVNALAVTSGNTYEIGDQQLINQGLCQMEMWVLGTTMAGRVQILSGDLAGNAVTAAIADTGMAHVIGAVQSYVGQVILPPQPTRLQWTANSTGSLTLAVKFTPLGH